MLTLIELVLGYRPWIYTTHSQTQAKRNLDSLLLAHPFSCPAATPMFLMMLGAIRGLKAADTPPYLMLERLMLDALASSSSPLLSLKPTSRPRGFGLPSSHDDSDRSSSSTSSPSFLSYIHATEHSTSQEHARAGGRGSDYVPHPPYLPDSENITTCEDGTMYSLFLSSLTSVLAFFVSLFLFLVTVAMHRVCSSSSFLPPLVQTSTHSILSLLERRVSRSAGILAKGVKERMMYYGHTDVDGGVLCGLSEVDGVARGEVCGTPSVMKVETERFVRGSRRRRRRGFKMFRFINSDVQ